MASVAAYESLDELGQQILVNCALYQRHFTFENVLNNLPYKVKKDKDGCKASYESLKATGFMNADGDFSNVANDWECDPTGLFVVYLKAENDSIKTDSFADKTVMDGILSKIPPEKVAEGHGLCGGTLYETYEDDLTPMFPLLQWHFNKAGDAEEEIKMAQMSASVYSRSKNYVEASKMFERVVELSSSVSFERYEAFDKAKHLAGWKVELGEIYYMQGKIDKAKAIMEDALGDMNCVVPTDNVKKLLNELVKKHAWTVFKSKDSGPIDPKWDNTDNADIKCLGRLFIIAVLELNEARVIEIGVKLMDHFISLNTPQGNAIACFLGMILQNQSEKNKMLVKKAISTLSSKALASFDSKDLFRAQTWAGLQAIVGAFMYGSNLEQATKFSAESNKSFKNLNNFSGELESLFCLCNCESATSTSTVGASANALHAMGLEKDNMAAIIWSSTFLVPLGGGLVNIPAGDSQESKDVAAALAGLRKFTEAAEPATALSSLPKSFQIMAHAVEAFGSIYASEAGNAERSLKSAQAALEIMKTSSNLKPFLKESYTAVAEVFLHLYKNKAMNDNNPVDGADVVSESLNELRRAAKEASECCESFGKIFTTSEIRGKAIAELVSLIEAKIDVNKCKNNLAKLSDDAKKGNLSGDVNWLTKYSGEGALAALGTATSVVVK